MNRSVATLLINGFGVALGTKLYHGFRYGIGDVNPARGLFVGAFVAVLMLVLGRVGSQSALAGRAGRE